MRNLKIIVSSLLFGISTVGQAQWNPTSSQRALTGTQLSQQYSASSVRQSQPGNLQTLAYLQNDHQEVNDVFNRDQSYKGLKFTNNNEITSSSSLYFSTEVSRNEQHLGSVYSSGNWRFGASVGQGENFVKANNLFTGIDPYFIHGGSAVKFNYYGANAGYQLNNSSTLYFGFSTVQAERLEDRQASYLGYTGKHLSAAIMNFQRGSESVGKGIEFATKIKNFDFGYRQLSRNNGAHSKTFSMTHPASFVKAGKFGFAVESTNNPLNRTEDDLAFMFTFSGEWGKPKSLFNLDESEEQTAESKGIKKMAVIGAAVVGGAVIASSGSSSKDNAEAFTASAQHDAARQILNEVNPRSVRENREYGGLIYRNPNGSYSNTEPVPGDNDSVLIPKNNPAGTQEVAIFHTHAAFDPNYDNENFSPTDINTANRANLDSYLGTPAGAFKFYDVSHSRISTLGSIAN